MNTASAAVLVLTAILFAAALCYTIKNRNRCASCGKNCDKCNGCCEKRNKDHNEISGRKSD